MKVTKIIREYIEEKIDAKYDPMIKEVEGKYSDEIDEYKNTLNSVADKLEIYARQEFRKALAKYYTPERLDDLLPTDIHNRRYLVNIPYAYNTCTKYVTMRDEELATLRAKRDKAIKNVLIGLELGGTKKDLDRLLEEALAEEV